MLFLPLQSLDRILSQGRLGLMLLLMHFPEGAFYLAAPGPDSSSFWSLEGQQGEACCRGLRGGSAQGRCEG